MLAKDGGGGQFSPFLFLSPWGTFIIVVLLASLCCLNISVSAEGEAVKCSLDPVGNGEPTEGVSSGLSLCSIDLRRAGH